MMDKIKKTKELATLLANVDGPHDVDDCHNYYDGCHCVEFLAADTKSIIDDFEKAQERILELEARQCYNLPMIIATMRDGDRDVIDFGDGPESWRLIPVCSVSSVHDVAESMRRSIGRCHDRLLHDLEKMRIEVKDKDAEIAKLQEQIDELAGKADIYDSAKLEVRMLTAQLQSFKRCSKCKSECGPCQCECHGYLYGYR